MTREQFESAIGTELQIIMGDDGMCCHVEYDPHTIYVDNGNGGVFEVRCDSATDISTDESYSIYPAKNETLDCVILWLNKTIRGIGRDGGFAIYPSKEEVDELVAVTRRNNEEFGRPY